MEETLMYQALDRLERIEQETPDAHECATGSCSSPTVRA